MRGIKVRNTATQQQQTTGALNSAAHDDQQTRTNRGEANDGAQYRSFNDGNLERVRVGKMADGTWGVRVYNSAGVIQVNQTYS